MSLVWSPSVQISAVEERIQVDRQPISPGELAELLTEIRDRQPAAVTPTFFEVATAAGFLYFVRRRVDAGASGPGERHGAFRP